jgi:hypothetical protein
VSGEATPGAGAQPITIAVDAMGGDHAPAAIVEGAAAAAAASASISSSPAAPAS